jgi:hypothetical protein
MTELIPLATCGEFTLYERKGCSTAQWRSLKLACRPRKAGRKNNWWLGWSVHDQRLSRNSDTKHLAENHPAALQWVIASSSLRSSSAKAAS